MRQARRQELSGWVADYARAARAEENVDAFVTHVDDAILAALPELGEDPLLSAEVHASTAAQFRSFLNVLDREEQTVVPPPQAHDLALAIARRGLDLGVLLKTYRIANDQVWAYFAEVADSVAADGPDRTDVLKFLYGRANHWVNDSLEQLIEVYVEERDSQLQGALARRAEVIQAVLRGDQLSPDLLTRDLGHQIRLQQTAGVVWLDAALPDRSTGELDAAAHAVARAVGAPRPLTVPAGSRDLRFWLATGDQPDLSDLTIAVEEISLPGVRVAVGRTAPGIDGFRSSHAEALDAQRCAVRSASPSPVTTYDAIELVIIQAGAPEAADRMAARELAGLASDDASLSKVRETLARFLLNGGNVEQTASDLVVHKNTVRYRLAQAEELVGHPLTERRTELDLALRWLDYRTSGEAEAPAG